MRQNKNLESLFCFSVWTLENRCVMGEEQVLKITVFNKLFSAHLVYELYGGSFVCFLFPA